MEIVLAVYAAASVAAFLAYGLDKRRAIRGRRRIPEAWLHLLELLGSAGADLVKQPGRGSLPWH